MKLTKIVALTALAASFGAQAASTTASTSTTDLGNLYQQLKESPLSLTMINSTGVTNGTEGYKNIIIGSLGYKLTADDSLGLENRFVFDQRVGVERNYLYRSVISYKRSNILTEAANGIGLSAKIEQRWLPDTAQRGAANQNGLTRISASASKTIGNVALSNTLYLARTLIKNKEDTTTSQGYLYGVLSQSLNVTDKAYVALVQEPFADRNKDGDSNMSLTMTAEVGYQINDQVSAAINVGGDMLSGVNEFAYNDGWTKKLGYGLDIVISAF